MREAEIINVERPLPVRLRAVFCRSFLCKLRGLSWRKSIPDDWGLLMDYRSDKRIDAGIHMLGMKFDLGIIWINNEGRVVDKKYARRWLTFAWPREPARYVLEILPALLDSFQVGDRITFEESA